MIDMFNVNPGDPTRVNERPHPAQLSSSGG